MQLHIKVSYPVTRSTVVRAGIYATEHVFQDVYLDIPKWANFLKTPGPSQFPLKRKWRLENLTIWESLQWLVCWFILEHLPVDWGHHMGLHAVHCPPRLGLVDREGLQRLGRGLEIKLGQHTFPRPVRSAYTWLSKTERSIKLTPITLWRVGKRCSRHIWRWAASRRWQRPDSPSICRLERLRNERSILVIFVIRN